MEGKACLSVILMVVLVSMATAAPAPSSAEKSVIPGEMGMSDSYNKFMPEIEQKFFDAYVKHNGMMADQKSEDDDSSGSKSSGSASASATDYTRFLPKIQQKFMEMYAGNIKKMLKI